jgi:hypothetical protein
VGSDSLRPSAAQQILNPNKLLRFDRSGKASPGSCSSVRIKARKLLSIPQLVGGTLVLRRRATRLNITSAAEVLSLPICARLGSCPMGKLPDNACCLIVYTLGMAPSFLVTFMNMPRARETATSAWNGSMRGPFGALDEWLTLNLWLLEISFDPSILREL